MYGICLRVLVIASHEPPRVTPACFRLHKPRDMQAADDMQRSTPAVVGTWQGLGIGGEHHVVDAFDLRISKLIWCAGASRAIAMYLAVSLYWAVDSS